MSESFQSNHQNACTCDKVTRNEAATIFTLFICVTVVRHNSAPAAALGTSRRCRSLDSSVGLPTSLTRPRPLLRYSPRRAGASTLMRKPSNGGTPGKKSLAASVKATNKKQRGNQILAASLYEMPMKGIIVLGHKAW